MRANLLDALYRDLLSPDWSAPFLAALTKATASRAAAVVSIDLQQKASVLDAYVGAEAASALAYDQEYAAQNPWSSAQRVHGQRAGEVIVSDTLVPLTDLKQTRFWSGFLKPLGLAHAVGVLGARSPSYASSLTLLRGERAGAYGGKPLALLNAISPHWANACALRMRLAPSAPAGGSVLAAFDAVAQPLFLLDTDRTLLRVNAAGDILLRESDPVLMLRAGALTAHTAQGYLRLDILVRAAGHFAALEEAPFVTLTDAAGSVRAFATAHPVPGLAAGNCVLLAVQPIRPSEGGRRSLMRALARTFGLTPRETELALLVEATQSLDEVAESMGITIESARTRFKVVCAKLGVRGRSGFAAALSALRGVLPPSRH